jgi:hypothetical protein
MIAHSSSAHIGIDPGASGAAALLLSAPAHPRLQCWNFSPALTPARALLEITALLPDDTPVEAVLEKVSAFPGQGLASTFKFGRAFGECAGALAALRIPYRLVTPGTWQRPLRAEGLAPRSSEGTAQHKRQLKAIALRRYPDHPVTLANADAILLADYAATLN